MTYTRRFQCELKLKDNLRRKNVSEGEVEGEIKERRGRESRRKKKLRRRRKRRWWSKS